MFKSLKSSQNGIGTAIRHSTSQSTLAANTVADLQSHGNDLVYYQGRGAWYHLTRTMDEDTYSRVDQEAIGARDTSVKNMAVCNRAYGLDAPRVPGFDLERAPTRYCADYRRSRQNKLAAAAAHFAAVMRPRPPVAQLISRKDQRDRAADALVSAANFFSMRFSQSYTCWAKRTPEQGKKAEARARFEAARRHAPKGDTQLNADIHLALDKSAKWTLRSFNSHGWWETASQASSLMRLTGDLSPAQETPAAPTAGAPASTTPAASSTTPEAAAQTTNVEA